MKNLLLLLLALSFNATGETPINHRASDFYGALNMSFEQKFRAKELIASWNAQELTLENELGFHQKGNCFDLSGGEVILILQVEGSGAVSEVYASKETPKASCFISAYKGVVLPKPPLAPLYKLQRML